MNSTVRSNFPPAFECERLRLIASMTAAVAVAVVVVEGDDSLEGEGGRRGGARRTTFPAGCQPSVCCLPRRLDAVMEFLLGDKMR